MPSYLYFYFQILLLIFDKLLHAGPQIFAWRLAIRCPWLFFTAIFNTTLNNLPNLYLCSFKFVLKLPFIFNFNNLNPHLKVQNLIKYSKHIQLSKHILYLISFNYFNQANSLSVTKFYQNSNPITNATDCISGLAKKNLLLYCTKSYTIKQQNVSRLQKIIYINSI